MKLGRSFCHFLPTLRSTVKVRAPDSDVKATATRITLAFRAVSTDSDGARFTASGSSCSEPDVVSVVTVVAGTVLGVDAVVVVVAGVVLEVIEFEVTVLTISVVAVDDGADAVIEELADPCVSATWVVLVLVVAVVLGAGSSIAGVFSKKYS